MSDIELVIKIPEEYFNIMKHNIAVGNPLCPLSQLEMVTTVANGTPLPKGHGRLIDEDTLEFREATVSYGYNWECGESTYAEEEIVCADDIWNAPTIIEADKERGSKK